MGTPSAFLSSNKQDYSTPWPLVEAVEREIGLKFTLDVCATANSAKAPIFYTKEDDALVQNWPREVGRGAAWCNPEYGAGVPEKFLDVALGFRAAMVTVFLLPANKSDQPWWHKLVIPYCSIWDVRGRVNFLNPETGVWPIGLNGAKKTNPQASKIVICGYNFWPGPTRSLVWR